MSKSLIQKDKETIWHPFTPLHGADTPLVVKSAKGVYIYTDDNRKILDGVSSWWVNIHGHANEEIADAIYGQARNLEHVIFAGFTHEPAIKLAENLLSVLPPTYEKVFFSDDGSTSVEVAVKMGLQFWHNKGQKKSRIIALEGAYHGDTFGSMSLAGKGGFNIPFESHLFDILSIPFPIKGREEETVQRFKEHIKDDDVGIFIFEPLIQGVAGMQMYSPELLDELIKLAHDNDIICIADEVMTGFGRTGRIFASDHLSHKPDLMCLSKGITGGTLPLGITACSEKVVTAFKDEDFNKTFFHGHSYTANPIICAAANTSFEILTSSTCADNIQRITESHANFRTKMTDHSKVKDARHLGTIIAIEIDTGENSSYFNNLRKEIYTYFLERDILLRPLGNVIYIMPPYIINDDELQRVYKAIEDFLDRL